MGIRRTAGLAVILAAVAGGAYYYQQYGRLPLQRGDAALPAGQATKSLMRLPRPYSDLGMVRGMAMLRRYPKPASEWQANEARIYADLLATRKFDILVVPFEVQEYGLDRATRSLMTAELSLAIGRAQSSPMPDPYLVQRALGEGARRLDPEVVHGLATRLGAKRIVWSYVGHDRNGAMTVTIEDEEWKGAVKPPASAKPVAHNYEHLAFSDESPAVEVYEALLPRVLKDLGYDAAAAIPKPADSSFVANDVPRTPFGLTGGEANPARDAYSLQLLGALAPRRAERTRERLFEKSLLATEHMTPTSPQYRALKARAYFHLGLRPAALKVLGAPATTEEKALHAALNGNLPELKAFIAQETQLVPRMLELLEANAIAADYGVLTQKNSAATAASLELPGKVWPVVATRAFTDWDWWAQQDNLTLKYMLDQELPVQGYTAEGIVRGAAAIGDLAKVQASADLSVLEHMHRLLAADPAKWCCTMPADRLTARDYLDFIDATATDNLMRRATFYTFVQASYDSAQQYLESMRSAFAGFPEFAQARADLEYRLAKQSEGAAREGHMKAAYVHALNAEYWSNGQSLVAGEAFALLSEMGRRDYGLPMNWYAWDIPFRPFYPESEPPGIVASFMLPNARAALKNSVSDFTPVRSLGHLLDKVTQKPAEMDALLESIKDRFHGCPDRDMYLAERSLRTEDFGRAEAYLREGIKDAPGDWSSYATLGSLLVHTARPEEAAQVFMSYPGFRPGSSENPVGLSNDAYEAGSYFYWSGEFELARPLYRIAADLNTGSEASMSSRTRLDMLDANYPVVLQDLLTLANRYKSPDDFRDYLGLLHAMGHSREAWSAFDSLVPRLRATELWETALVGQRMERKSESDIAAWAARGGFKDVGKTRGHAALYLVRAGVTDRMPSAALAKSVAALAWPVWRARREGGIVLRLSLAGGFPVLVGTHAPSPINWPTREVDTTKMEPVTSDLVYFVEAYRALRLDDAKRAEAILREASSFYDLTNNNFRHLLPYYAFAAAKLGDTSAVEKLLARIDAEQRGFYYYLSKAVISGLGSRTDESLRLLKRALFLRYVTSERPVYTDYQYTETIEWLYRETGKPQYRDAALDWAKKVERFAPWYAWPYAMQAELESNAAERRRAIAMAAYLDPGSERLAKLPKAEVASAVRAFKGLNPFLQQAGGPHKGSI